MPIIAVFLEMNWVILTIVDSVLFKK
ncbi:Protein of unknown function [Bacillus wiedmannii]|nr:Protein of unknown function [Bacillus wiedmannii]